MRANLHTALSARLLVMLAIAMAVPGLTGCASMKVQVAVFDRNYMDSTPFLSDEVATLRRSAEVAVRNHHIERGASRAAGKYADEIIEKVANRIPDKDAKRLRADLKTIIYNTMRPRIAAAVAATQQAIDTAHEARAVSPSEDERRRQKFADAIAKFAEARRRVRAVIDISADEIQVKIAPSLLTLVEQGLQSVREGEPRKQAAQEKIKVLVASAKPAAEQAFKTIAPNNLFDDPITPLIVSAPEQAWRGTYNSTEGFGSFGNTDIAVVMQEFGLFTIKGVRNDTQKATEATFHSINLLVSLAAVSAGIPPGTFKALSLGNDSTATESGDTSGQSGTTLTSDLSGADEKAEAARAVIRRQRSAAVAILSAIASQRNALEASPGTPEARKAAVESIKKTFQENVSELKASLVPPASSSSSDSSPPPTTQPENGDDDQPPVDNQ